VRRRIAVFICVVQAILFLGHGILYATCVWFWRPLWQTASGQDNAAVWWLRGTIFVLSVSFVAASMLAFNYYNLAVRIFYTIAAAWLGVFNFLLWAACLSWILYGAAFLAWSRMPRWPIASVLFATAAVAGVYGIINAARVRTTRITVKLPNLPAAWRGRTAGLVSDTHLGHVRNRGFIERIVAMLQRAKPDVVFIAGDLYDGTAADIDGLAEPLDKLAPPLGTYFIAGNHEEFSNHDKYFAAVRRAGVRVVTNEKVMLDGLQLIGVHYHDASHPENLRRILQTLGIDRERTSILLTHAPDHPQIAAEEGISLQLSGHTHQGQFLPYTWIVKRMYRQFAYGLSRLGEMFVYTSCGAGTWGPPVRLGTNPEIVLITFE
jgi:uncharacterized protein